MDVNPSKRERVLITGLGAREWILGPVRPAILDRLTETEAPLVLIPIIGDDAGKPIGDADVNGLSPRVCFVNAATLSVNRDAAHDQDLVAIDLD